MLNGRLRVRALAESEIGGAVSLTREMESASTLPSASSDAINALDSMSVSGKISGYDPETGHYNMNMEEMKATARNQSSYSGASTAVTGSNIVHDGTHAVQNAAGQLRANTFASVPTNAGGRDRFFGKVIATERAANQAQGQFIQAVPHFSANVKNSVSTHLSSMSNTAILSRYCGRGGTGC